MIKEIRYLIFLLIIFFFIFFVSRYYFSEPYEKKSYRSLININQKIKAYTKKLPTLNDDTKNVIEYVKNNEIQKKKKYNFWRLLDKNE